MQCLLQHHHGHRLVQLQLHHTLDNHAVETKQHTVPARRPLNLLCDQAKFNPC